MSSPQRPDHGEWLQRAREHLRAADPVLAVLIDKLPGFDPRAWLAQLPPLDLFGALLFQVAGQQLSVAATRRTLARIEDLFGGSLPAADQLLRADPADLRQAGLSWRKIATLRDLAAPVGHRTLNAQAITRLAGDETIAPLSEVPAIATRAARDR